MKKIGTIMLAGLIALAIFISPMVFSMPDSAYAAAQPTQEVNSVGTLPVDAPMHRGGRGDKGHKPSQQQIIGILAEWSGFPAEDIAAIQKQYNLGIPQLINTVILAKAGNISLDEAAKIVSEGNLKQYIEQNKLQEKFMETRRELAQYMRGFRDGFKHGVKHAQKKAPGIKGRVWNDFTSVLANWAGIPTQTIASIQKDYNLNPARTINAVVLAKVGNIDLQVSASIVVNGNLRSYLDQQGLTEAFQTARQEVMQLLREEAQNLKEKAEDKVSEVLAQWSGFDKDKIAKLIEEKNVGYAVTVVVLGKVAGISLDEAKQIVDDGKLMTYIRENNLFVKFRQAKMEVMRLISQALRP
ncbi:MAG: hypothetical protein GXO59_04805 [Dictyoglomi bacterium]|nr:hypothetical protein [Dictyoglomota bacterium]